MGRFLILMALVASALLASVVSFGDVSEADTTAQWTSGPLLSCPDVNGDGVVTLVGDILDVAGAFGKFGDSNYAYIFDVANGDGVVNVIDDILYIASRFGDVCTDLIDRQVALGTRAIMQYQNCQDAIDFGGYVQSTQFVPAMGIHLVNNLNMVLYTDFYSGDPNDTDDQLRHPMGIMCTDSDADPNNDVPDRLIGAFYTVPNPEVCLLYTISGPCQDISTQPVGFGTTITDEDNIAGFNDGAPQQTWHTHPNLCVWNVGTTQALTAENVNQTTCEVTLGGVWFSTYGWMMHLYAFIPHQQGRFMMWNGNVPGEGQ